MELVLKKVMQPLSRKAYGQLFEWPGPLSSFANKIQIVYAFRVTTPEIDSQLEKIRQLRNKFAHSTKLLHFGSEEVSSLFRSLKRPESPSADIRQNFLSCTSLVHNYLNAHMESPTPTLPAPTTRKRKGIG